MRRRPAFHPVVIAWLALLLVLVAITLVRSLMTMADGLIHGMPGSTLDERLTAVILFLGLLMYAAGITDLLRRKKAGIWKMLFSNALALGTVILVYAIMKVPINFGGSWWLAVQFYVGIPVLSASITMAVLLIRKDGESAWSKLEY